MHPISSKNLLFHYAFPPTQNFCSALKELDYKEKESLKKEKQQIADKAHELFLQQKRNGRLIGILSGACVSLPMIIGLAASPLCPITVISAGALSLIFCSTGGVLMSELIMRRAHKTQKIWAKELLQINSARQLRLRQQLRQISQATTEVQKSQAPDKDLQLQQLDRAHDYLLVTFNRIDKKQEVQDTLERNPRTPPITPQMPPSTQAATPLCDHSLATRWYNKADQALKQLVKKVYPTKNTTPQLKKKSPKPHDFSIL